MSPIAFWTFPFFLALALAIVFLAVGIRALLRYRRARDRETLLQFASCAVIAIIISSLNVAYLYPWVDYDAVRYETTFLLLGNGTGRLVLPLPEEEGLVKQLLKSPYDCTVVETDRGTGLQINFTGFTAGFTKRLYLTREYQTRDHNVDYTPALMTNGKFFFFLEIGEANLTVHLAVFRILHQGPWDFHSRQCIGEDLVAGWNELSIEIRKN